ncbi:NAD-dependent epimerase/dehydratase family protein, partial [Candidatus Bathyarchaeota archaeon]|nr:NAD-dependent epimerase/dehydratase family protein [Candidatus Bathyarchaeota archaeon]
MKVMVMGMDGYLGWTLSMHLSGRGHDVCGVDNMSRRRNVQEIGSWSATPIKSMKERLEAYKKATGRELRFYEGDLQEPSFTDLVIGKEKPDCIVHFGEIPSAPYSMIDLNHCNYTQMN